MELYTLRRGPIKWWFGGVKVLQMWGIPRSNLLVRWFTRRGCLPCRPWADNSSAQACRWWGDRATHLLNSRATLSSVVTLLESWTFLPVRVAGGGAPVWDLPVETEGEAVSCTQPPLLVLSGCAGRAIPELLAVTSRKGVFVVVACYILTWLTTVRLRYTGSEWSHGAAWLIHDVCLPVDDDARMTNP